MNYRHMGRSGLELSELSLGTWLTVGGYVDEATAERCVHVAYEHGINSFDTAEGYGSGAAETALGAILGRTRWPRESLVIATKLFWGTGGEHANARGLSRKRVIEGFHASLRRLGLDYVDILYCHRPDLDTPIEETVHAMHDLIVQGKALYWGTSVWEAEQIREAWHLADRHGLHKPQIEQAQYSMLHRERVEKEYHRLYDGIGMGISAWSPLASGVLTGKYRDGAPAGSRLARPGLEWLRDQQMSPAQVGKARQLEPVARELGCSLAQLALAWCLRNPRVSTVILGASRPEQVEENLGALAVTPKLDDAVRERIEGILANRPEVNRY